MKKSSGKPLVNKTRIAVVGTGMVGSSFAYAAMIKGIAAEIIMIDANEAREEGEVMDLSHALIGSGSGNVKGGSFEDCQDVDVVVITAGVSQKPGDTRLDLLNKNVAITKDIIRKMGKLRSDTVVLVVSNPVDILTYVAQQHIKLPKNQIFGSGTSLDTSRLRFNIGLKLGINLRNIHGYVMGEHGDSEFVVWSQANVSHVPVKKLLTAKQMKEIEDRTMRAAYEIIARKHSTYYGIGVVATELVDKVLRDRRYIVPVSYEPLPYGIRGVCLGVPCVLSRNGVEQVWKIELSAGEKRKLKKSATVLKKHMKHVKL
jgi:L-lactate dehydrogenase